MSPDSVGLSDVEQRIVDYVDRHAGEAVEFLETTVNINSGTMNHEGVRDVGSVYANAFDEIGFETSWVDMPPELNRSGHLFAEHRGSSGKRILLIGHLDTVFERDSPFQRFERMEDGWARGPGTEDMKGGNTVILFALKALRDEGVLNDAQVIVALLGDEEFTGRPHSISRAALVEAAKRSDVALGFEGLVDTTNNATVARRGYTGWTLQVSGRRGHSSLIFGEEYGSGAAFEAARILNQFYDEVRGEEYLTLGAGIILGGTQVEYDPQYSRGTAFGKANVIPQTVVMRGDLRTISQAQTDRAVAKMQAIVTENLPGTSATITFDPGMPPMSPSEANFELLRELSQVSEDLGLGPVEAVDPGRRGAADVSFVSDYTAALDGLGVLGFGGHTTEERIDLASLRLATKRAALLIYRLTRE